MTEKDVLQFIHDYYNRLDDKERIILELRFGKASKTLDEIAKMMNYKHRSGPDMSITRSIEKLMR